MELSNTGPNTQSAALKVTFVVFSSPTEHSEPEFLGASILTACSICGLTHALYSPIASEIFVIGRQPSLEGYQSSGAEAAAQHPAPAALSDVFTCVLIQRH